MFLALVKSRNRWLSSSSPSSSSSSSVLNLFKSVGKFSQQKIQNSPYAKTLLGVQAPDEEEKPRVPPLGEHARALEKDLLVKVRHDHGHGHSHSGEDGDHGHSHAGDDGDHGHGHSHGNDADKKDDNEDDDFVEMWNPQAPAGPEHGGPRGKEPTRYGNEWEKNGRVTDFS